jgi:hypothetical protein
MGADNIRDDEEPEIAAVETADETLETEQLALDEDERLPWLESADDDEEPGVDTGRIMGLLVLGLVALGVILGGIWWFTRGTPDPALVANGSTIAAPAGPYKEAPKDAGGKKFDGTGDSSFAVSEGQTRPAQIAGAVPKPSVDIGPKPGAAAAPAGGVGVQVAAFSSQAAAEAGWGKLSGQYSALSGVPHRVVSGRADIGTVYRLQAVAPDAAAANALCGKLKAAGLSCQVK